MADYQALWDSGVLSVSRERDPWEALQEGLPLLGFARPEVEFLAPSEIEGDSLLAVEEQQELITAFAEVGAGEVWCWAGSAVWFVDHEPAIAQLYAPSFGLFVWRCFIENMKSFELELFGREMQAAEAQQILKAGLATATPFLSDTQLASIRAVLERSPELVQTKHGGKTYRFARFIEDDAATAMLVEQIPPGDLDRRMGEADWAD